MKGCPAAQNSGIRMAGATVSEMDIDLNVIQCRPMLIASQSATLNFTIELL